MSKQQQQQQPDVYDLTGQGVHVTYMSTGIAGRPSLIYQDGAINKTFVGDEIRVAEVESGQLASVSIKQSVDTGYTSFTLMLPRVNLLNGEPTQVDTLGIVEVHRLTVDAPAFGQLDTYQVVPLQGTTSQVDF